MDMGLLGGEKLIVGYDLGNLFSQISFAVSPEGEVETLSQVAGGQVYNIPTVLCRKHGTSQWFYGREAIRSAREDQGVLVENLLDLALEGEQVAVDGEVYDPVALLTLFFKRSLGMLPRPVEKITALMITCPVFNERVRQVFSQVVEGARLKAGNIAFQSHGESYYSYMLRQPRELWNSQPVLFDYRANSIRLYRLGCNRRTTPRVAFLEQKEYPFPECPLLDEDTQEAREERDRVLCRIAEEVCGREVTGSVFLIGDGFAGDWMKNTLRYLCRGRRVFQGNNLFGKGACCGMQERLKASQMGTEHVFLGGDKLKANVGMKILRNGEDSYFALLDAGVNWYEAERTAEIYLQEGRELEFSAAPLVRSRTGAEVLRLSLEGLPGTTARLRLHLYMEAENRLTVEAEDLGFGEFRPASGRSWKESFVIY